MFDFFRFKKNVEVTEVVTPIKPPPEPVKPKVYYRLGLTDTNRVALQMNYSEISMNKRGCEAMIKQLQFYMDQLDKEEQGEYN